MIKTQQAVCVISKTDFAFSCISLLAVKMTCRECLRAFLWGRVSHEGLELFIDNTLSRFLSLSVHRARRMLFRYRALPANMRCMARLFVHHTSQITSVVPSPFINNSVSLCSLAINIQMSPECLPSYLGKAPLGSAALTGKELYSERMGVLRYMLMWWLLWSKGMHSLHTGRRAAIREKAVGRAAYFEGDGWRWWQSEWGKMKRENQAANCSWSEGIRNKQ